MGSGRQMEPSRLAVTTFSFGRLGKDAKSQ
jgi:hypothetical protein